MSCYWDIIPRDLQTFIAKIALLEEKATKIQRTLRANRPLLGMSHIWTTNGMYVIGDGLIDVRSYYTVGDKVLVQTVDNNNKKLLAVGYVDKLGLADYLYDCRVKVPRLNNGRTYYDIYYYYSKQKRVEWDNSSLFHLRRFILMSSDLGPFPIKSVTVIQT